MKKHITIISLFLIITVTGSAKKASAMWFFLEKKSTSVIQDDNINVEYGIYTKFANENYALGPYPFMRIKIKNKSDKIIYIDLGTSYLKNNDIASVIYNPTITSTTTGRSVGIGVNAGSIANSVGIGGIAGDMLQGVNIGGGKSSSTTTTTYVQRVVSVPPKSSIILNDVQLFTADNSKALSHLLYFKEEGYGKQRRLWCLAHKFNDVESGKVIQYNEENTLFNIGCYLNYSFSSDFKESNGIETTYYVKMLIGSSVSTFGNKEFNIVDKTFPEWRDEIGTGNLELIRLWAK